jgi:phosphoribosylglycinamide formyltransferase 1
MKPPPRLAVLGSGRGTNFVAIHEAIQTGKLNAEIAIVMSDVPDAPILARAREYGIPAGALPPSPFKTKLGPDAESMLIETIQQCSAQWVILAGYMRVVKEPLLSLFPNRIINIHPSLLPAFKGLRAWEQALAAGIPETGCTVHFVNQDIDAGEIIAQQRVPILLGDTPETLHARIQVAEHDLYPRALAEIFQRES